MNILQYLLPTLTALTAVYCFNAVILENRSLQSRFVQDFLTVRDFFKSKNESKILQSILERGRAQYQWPKRLNLKTSQSYYEVDAMPVYKLNSEASSAKEILYIHGGAYVHEAVKLQLKMIDRLSHQSNIEANIPVYPLAPENNYRDSYAKVLNLYHRLLESHSPNDIILIGDSAGGGHALGLAQLLKDKGLPQPGKIILLSPWIDITLSNPRITASLEKKDKMLTKKTLLEDGRAWAGDSNPKEYLLSPINGDMNNLAPITIIIGSYEIFLPDSQDLYKKLRDIGNNCRLYVYDKMQHVFPALPIPEANKALEQIVQIISDTDTKKEPPNS